MPDAYMNGADPRLETLQAQAERITRLLQDVGRGQGSALNLAYEEALTMIENIRSARTMTHPEVWPMLATSNGEFARRWLVAMNEDAFYEAVSTCGDRAGVTEKLRRILGRLGLPDGF